MHSVTPLFTKLMGFTNPGQVITLPGQLNGIAGYRASKNTENTARPER